MYKLISVFCDLSKAFDTISHNTLLHKLDNYGVRGKANDFLRSYLSSRNQYTVFNNASSSLKQIHYGVPQGSILGPLLFLIYIKLKFNQLILKKCSNTYLYRPWAAFSAIPRGPAQGSRLAAWTSPSNGNSGATCTGNGTASTTLPPTSNPTPTLTARSKNLKRPWPVLRDCRA